MSEMFKRIFGKTKSSEVVDPVQHMLLNLEERLSALERNSSRTESTPQIAAITSIPLAEPEPQAPATSELPEGFEDPEARSKLTTQPNLLPQPGEQQEAFEARIIGAGLSMTRVMPTLLALVNDGALSRSVVETWPAFQVKAAAAAPVADENPA